MRYPITIPRRDVDRAHPLNAGLLNWWYSYPGVNGFGSRQLMDIAGVKHKHAAINGAGSEDWLFDSGIQAAAIDLDGTGDYLDPSITGLYGHTGSALTVVARVLSHVVSTRQAVLGDWDSGAANQSMAIEFGGYLQTAGNITTVLGGPSIPGGYQYLNSGVAAVNDTWYQIAVTYDGRSGGSGPRAIYVDGILRASDTCAIPRDGTTTAFGRGGAWTGVDLNGRIADIRFYNRVLDAGQIAGLYRESLAGYPNLLARARVPMFAVPAAAATAFPWHYYAQQMAG